MRVRNFLAFILSAWGKFDALLTLKWNKKLIGILLFSSYLQTTIAAAPKQQAVGYSLGASSPIITTTTDLMTKGSFAFSERLEFYHGRPLSDTQLLFDPLAESSNDEYFNYLMIGYGLGEKLTIGATVSYTHGTNFRSASIDEEEPENSEVIKLGNISGIGDSNVYALGSLFEEGKRHPSAALLAGINIPTGRTNVRNSLGDLFVASDQPGNGAWDPFASLVFSKKWDRVMMSLNLGYTQATEGSQDTTLGSYFEYNFATVYQIYKNEKKKFDLDGILELNSWTAAKDVIGGVEDDHSGGSGVFVTPGLRVNMKDSLSFYIGITAPLIEQYNGLQAKTNYGLISGIDVYF